MDVDSSPPSGLSARDEPAPDMPYPGDFAPNRVLVTEIATTLQVHETWVVQGIYLTKLTAKDREPSKDEVFAWVLENHPRFIEISSSESGSGEEEAKGAEGGTKMVFVVNNELRMTPGKMAAQVAHGAIELFTKLTEDQQAVAELGKWMESGAKKVVVRCDNTEHLFDLREEADSAGLKYAQICDAGLTQVASGSVTCLAVFGSAQAVKGVTGTLRLLE